MKLDLEAVGKLVDDGYISVQKHPDAELYIYNYTHKAQFDKVWNEHTMLCRGLICDQDGNILYRPFKKFFNLEEHLGQKKELPTTPFKVHEKLDGSLGIIYKVNGQYAVATRGSFKSEQALHHKRYFTTKKPEDKQNEFLPHAIICDLDGTLALLNGRNPYDASTAAMDLLNKPIADILKRYQFDCHIILVSGRKSIYKGQTTVFLVKHDLITEKTKLYMRGADDNRKDAIVKKEIYDRYIKDKYYVKFVLDDRDQVVEMWRKEGLTCLQVAEGNF